MSEIGLILVLGCALPTLMFGVALFACELRIQYRDGDTRRYPRYGRADEMRADDKFKVKSRYGDKET